MMLFLLRWDKHRNPQGDPAMVFVVKEMTKSFRNSNSLVIADSLFESMRIMEWGKAPENMIAMCMSFGNNSVCHPDFFRSKSSATWKHYKNNTKRGTTFITHSDCATFTMFKDSSVLRLVDNDLDFEVQTDRVIRRFNKNQQGPERWKGCSKVVTTETSTLLLIL